MGRNIARVFESLLVVVVLASVGLGVTWAPDPHVAPLGQQAAARAGDVFFSPTPAPAAPTTPFDATDAMREPEVTSTPGSINAPIVATPVAVNLQVDEHALTAQDAPLLQQAPGTINILLLGSDASADSQYARTDTIIVASIDPRYPSVSLLSFPRDLQVRLPDGTQDRINTVMRRGYLSNHPGGGPAFLALVLRKNFGIKVDHFVRVDFAGLIKAVDALGGIEVLVECELHDTFPDKDSPSGKSDLDLYPGKVTLNGKQALWYARSRWSTTDFDRARRQQKVLRALFRKARDGNMLQNALGLYGEFRSSVETDLGPTDLIPLIDIARRLSNDDIKSRVITWPVVRSHQREDGASVLLPTEQTIPFIAEALAPPAGNQAQIRPAVEVYNGSSRPDMELVAAERLAWEGFQVIGLGRVDGDRFPQTQIIDYSTTRKGSPIARLQDIFRVQPRNVIGQPDPSSPSAARIILGEDYDSCPNTANIAGDVRLQAAGEQIGVTPAP
ncbi:MAG: LCP family protein [Thermoflexales bacterium]|nr:LCP family protein [Thermoflexales bacterium]MDW8350591.1 LCP family protein [Anaerolineae bacterium]